MHYYFILAASLSSPLLSQSSITRVVTSVDTSISSASNVAPYSIGANGSSGLPETPSSYYAGSPGFFTDPGLAGVEMASFSFGINFRAEMELQVLANDPAGTTFYVNWRGNTSSCGDGQGQSQCVWGSDQNGVYTGASSNQTAAPGEVASGSSLYEASHGRSWTRGTPQWDQFLDTTHYYGHISMDPAYVNVRDANGMTGPTATVQSFEATVSSRFESTAEFSLLQTPLLQTCVPLDNSTGRPGILRAYGSRVSGTEWLTVRSSQLPPNQACLLFMGTAPAFVPAGNYNVCIGGALTREGDVQITTAAGEADHEISLVGRPAGATLYVQVLHRDPTFGVAATEAAAFFVE